MASRTVSGDTGTSAQTPPVDLTRIIRDKLPIQNRQHFMEVEAWLTDGDDDMLTTEHN